MPDRDAGRPDDRGPPSEVADIYDRTIQRTNHSTFVIALSTIAIGALIALFGVWGLISR